MRLGNPSLEDTPDYSLPGELYVGTTGGGRHSTYNSEMKTIKGVGKRRYRGVEVRKKKQVSKKPAGKKGGWGVARDGVRKKEKEGMPGGPGSA